jgi:hypothetical protein
LGWKPEGDGRTNMPMQISMPDADTQMEKDGLDPMEVSAEK